MLDQYITNTFIGRKYGWDRVSEANPSLLRNNREAGMRVLNNPDRYPNADFAHIRQHVAAIDTFFNENPLLERFA